MGLPNVMLSMDFLIGPDSKMQDPMTSLGKRAVWGGIVSWSWMAASRGSGSAREKSPTPRVSSAGRERWLSVSPAGQDGRESLGSLI